MVMFGDEREPELECDGCDMMFTLTWHRNPVYLGIEFCPFCGEEVEEILDQIEYEE